MRRDVLPRAISESAERAVGRKLNMATAAHLAVCLEDGKTLLRVEGVIQSVVVDDHHEPDVWDAMIPSVRPHSALILGLGGGTIASLLTRRYGAMPIVGVERDARVVTIARDAFGLGRLAHVQIVLADARQFVADCRAAFGLICVDLYTGGKLEHGVLDATFLLRVARLLTPGGIITINLWSSAYLPDQLRRIQRVLAIRDVVEVGRNVVVHCALGTQIAIQR